jgi:replicative DNA helicase
VPGWVSTLPKEQVGLFLRHLWAAHGSVAWDQAHGAARLCYASSSRRLVDDVARLLLRFNVFTRITRARSRGTGDTGWQLVVHGAENQIRFLDDIGVHGARAGLAAGVARLLRAGTGNVDLDAVPDDVWDRVRDLLVERADTPPRQLTPAPGSSTSSPAGAEPEPVRETMARVAEVLGESDLDVLATNDVYWDTITGIEPVGEQPVYDATVLGTHNFVADGIAAHNSLEQDADMVILLHRDDVYEKESTRPGEADLIVAKHRNGPTRDIVVAFQGHYSRFVDMAH